MPQPLVPDDFEAPTAFTGSGYRLEPLGPQHNARDHDAWMSSIEHIRSTPGFEDRGWPTPMTLDENLADLEQHALEFDRRIAFAYSILDGDRVIGCLYIDPDAEYGAAVRSWMTASHKGIDPVVRTEVSAWLRDEWRFDRFRYAASPDDGGRSTASR